MNHDVTLFSAYSCVVEEGGERCVYREEEKHRIKVNNFY